MSTLHTRPSRTTPTATRQHVAASGAASGEDPVLATNAYTIYEGNGDMPCRNSPSSGRSPLYDSDFGAFGPLGRSIQMLPTFEDDPDAFLEIPVPFPEASECTEEQSKRRRRFINNIRSCVYAVNKAVRRKSRGVVGKHDRVFTAYVSSRLSVIICRSDRANSQI